MTTSNITRIPDNLKDKYEGARVYLRNMESRLQEFDESVARATNEWLAREFKDGAHTVTRDGAALLICNAGLADYPNSKSIASRLPTYLNLEAIGEAVLSLADFEALMSEVREGYAEKVKGARSRLNGIVEEIRNPASDADTWLGPRDPEGNPLADFFDSAKVR